MYQIQILINPMKQTFYFKHLGGWPFSMDVTINNDQHRINFLASMSRKKYMQVTEAEYKKDSRIRSQYASMCKH
jgi:hypothetical protein